MKKRPRKIILRELAAFLDSELRLEDFPDDESPNGLQVEGRSEVSKVAVAVDACDYVFEKAAEEKADFIFVHHGLIWGGLKSIRGIMKNRIGRLLAEDISLYACHLPLDRHPVYGNNARILDILSLRRTGEFGTYRGKNIGWRGRAAGELPFSEFVARVDSRLKTKSVAIDFTGRVRNVGVVSGGGWSAIHEASKLGVDTLLTGEPAHAAYCSAEEMGINLVFAGHYATETPGVSAVGAGLRNKFGLEVVFIDHPSGL